MMDVKIDEVTGNDRDLLVVALQALHRERVTAFQAACTAGDLAGIPSPNREHSGLAEVSSALRRVGAGPL
jgi:hypothetical protein